MSYHFTHWPILAVAIAGCSPMDAIEGKPSAQREHIERVAMVTLPTVAVAVEPVNLADGIAPAPVAAPALMALIEPTPVTCVVVYRVTTCDDGAEQDVRW